MLLENATISRTPFFFIGDTRILPWQKILRWMRLLFSFGSYFHILSFSFFLFWFEAWPRLWILCIILQQTSFVSPICTLFLLSLHLKECLIRNMFRIIASTPFILILYYTLHQQSFRKLNRESSSNHRPLSLIHFFRL